MFDSSKSTNIKCVRLSQLNLSLYHKSRVSITVPNTASGIYLFCFQFVNLARCENQVKSQTLANWPLSLQITLELCSFPRRQNGNREQKDVYKET